MKIMGIDASTRNTGVVVVKFVHGTTKIDTIYQSKTFKTKKAKSTLKEYHNMLNMTKEINEMKLINGVWCSVCEIAHGGQNYSAALNVGITWGISMLTHSEPYLSHTVRRTLNIKGDAKQEVLSWLLSHNLHLASVISSMDHHQVDALACATVHYQLNHT